MLDSPQPTTPPTAPTITVPTSRRTRPLRATGSAARAVDRTREVTALLARRPELVGVHLPADTLAATVTWAV